MRFKLCWLILIGIFFFSVESIDASTGRLVQSSVKLCKSNNTYYGYHTSEGVKHYHAAVKNGGEYWMAGEVESLGTKNPCSTTSSSNNSENNSNNSQDNITTSNESKNETYVKNSDTSLKSITIDGENIKIKTNMEYKTKKDAINLKIIANNKKTNLNYKNDIKLSIGNNNIKIVAVAENGDEKTYSLNIVREKELSNNTNIIIKIDGDTIKFDNFESEEIIIDNSIENLNITYELEDNNAKVEILNNDSLEYGSNYVLVKVTAEDGTIKEYKINYLKENESSDNSSTAIGVGVLMCGIGACAYSFSKKKKSKKFEI